MNKTVRMCGGGGGGGRWVCVNGVLCVHMWYRYIYKYYNYIIYIGCGIMKTVSVTRHQVTAGSKRRAETSKHCMVGFWSGPRTASAHAQNDKE